MRNRMKGILLSIASAIASLAMVVAVGNFNSTCLFLTYQPDVPTECEQ